jgi:aspartate-semialdehyde dehydrogenase
MTELEQATRSHLEGIPYQPVVFRENPTFSVFSHDSPVDPETGYCGEEIKIRREVHKILDPGIAVTATCIRVPVLRAHCEAVSVQLQTPASEREFRTALRAAPGVTIVDDRSAGRFPTAARATGQHDVLVGRIRPDRSFERVAGAGEERWTAFHLFLAGDQLLKGAALNAFQIAERLWRRQGTARGRASLETGAA